MSKTLRATTLAGLAVLATAVLAGQDKNARLAPEQSNFSEADPIRRTVPISPAVLKALLATEEVRDALAYAKPSERSTPSQFFRATEIHLHAQGEVDWVVAGVRDPMSGADNDWYWIVRAARTNPQVVLFIDASGFSILNSRTQGYRDIGTFWSSASSHHEATYQFDGKQYKLWKEKWSDIKP